MAGGSLALSSIAAAESKKEEPTSTGGAIGSIGHLAFPTFGRNTSITPIEVFPYYVDDSNFFFGEARGFVSNYGTFGGNFGLGYRYLDEGMMSWYGGSFWYDADDTTDLLFHQVGVSLEAVVENWELRSNLYLPVGDTNQTFGTSNFAAEFVGNQLLFDSTTRYGNAMKGVDFEAGYSTFFDVLGIENTVRGFLGGYFFSGDNVDNINGFKARGEVVFSNSVTTQVLYTSDQTFGDNVMVGVTLDFPWAGAHPTSQWKRAMPSPFRKVERNYNVIVGESASDLQDVVAINPATGLPYNVQHVASNGGPGADGTVADPFDTVADAQAAGGDLIYVHSGTVLNEVINLGPGEHLLGEGLGLTIAAEGFGNIRAPQLAGGVAPEITGINGPAITLTSNSTISGFRIHGINGDGIVGDGVSNVTIRNVTLSGITGDAIRISNGSGNFEIDSVLVDTTPGRGLVINGGNADYRVAAGFEKIGGDAVTIEGTTGGSVSLTGLYINDSSARGVYASGNAGSLLTNNFAIDGVVGDGFVIEDMTGNVTLDGISSVENAAGRGFVIDGLDEDATIEVNDLRVASTSTEAAVDIRNTEGEVTLDLVSLNTDGGAGVVVRNADDLTIEEGTVTTVGATGVDIEDSDVTMTFRGIAVDGGPVGIRIVDTNGSFAVTGVSTALGAGGTIKNTDTAVLLENAGTVVLQRMNMTDNEFGVTSVGTDYVVLDYVQIADTTHYALDSLNDALLSVSNSLMTDNGSIGEGTIRVRADAFGTYQAQILQSTIQDANGTPISYSNSGAANGSTLGLLMQNTVIHAERGGVSAVKIDWNGVVGLTLDHNEFNLNKSNMTGLDVLASSATDKLTATLTNNIVNLADTDSTAFKFVAAGTSKLQFGLNGVAFQGGNGTAFRFDLDKTAEVVLDSNQIVDNAFGGTGFLFDEIAAGSKVTIEGNEMKFLSTGLVVDRGIVFTTVGDTIQLVGTRNNVISGATTNVSAPAGSTTGTIKVNGSNVP